MHQTFSKRKATQATFVASVLLGSALVLSSPASGAVLVNFDGLTDISTNFNVSTVQGTGTVTNLTTGGAVNTVGVGGSGGIVRTPVPSGDHDFSLTYKGSSYNPSLVPVTVSMMFRKSDATDSSVRPAIVGILAENNQFFAGGSNNFLAARLETVSATGSGTAETFRFRVQAQNPAQANADVGTTFNGLVDGNWYRLSATFLRRTVLNSFDISIALQDFGTSGTVPGSVVQSFNNFIWTNGSLSTIYGDTAVWGGMRSRFSGGASALDNFSVAIPEPAAIIAGLLGASTLLVRRRSL
jgi:hypothetical protein